MQTPALESQLPIALPWLCTELRNSHKPSRSAWRIDYEVKDGDDNDDNDDVCDDDHDGDDDDDDDGYEYTHIHPSIIL